jgi:WD40 repeat protein
MLMKEKKRRFFTMQKKNMQKVKNDFLTGRILVIGVLLSLLLCVFPLSAQKWECVDLEDLTPGQTFKLGDTFIDSGTKVEIVQTIGPDGKLWPYPGRAVVYKGQSRAGGSGNEIFMDPFNLHFHFNYPLNGLRLRFSEWGVGNINIEINGDLKIEPHFLNINGSTIGGVQVTVIGGLKDQKGILELNGRIDSFTIGGFELYIDDVCPIMEGTSLYFSDSTESTGSVYQFRADTGTKTAIYTRPSARLYSFVFAPWDPNQLFFVNANDTKVFAVSLNSGTLTEQVIFTHTTYIRDIAFDSNNNLYFSESSGAGGDGKIWRLETDGTAALFYTVLLSKFGGFWAGTFTFAPDGTLYISNGNVIGASLYEVDVAANAVKKVLSSAGEAIVGIAFGPDDLLYYANNKTRIYSVDIASLGKKVAYEDPGQQIWDVGFCEPAPVQTIPGTWVMPYSIRDLRFNQIKATGLIDYTDPTSGIKMKDAPFGADLWFRLHSSNDIPTPDVYYYRYRYRLKGTMGWNDFDATISVHYVKNRPGKTPIFPTFKLGPYDINGMKVYRFRPHEFELPSLVSVSPSETVEWPKIPFPGDAYRAYLNTVSKGLAPGEYEIRMDIYNSGGVQTVPGGAYQMIWATGTDTDGTIITDPASLDNGGVQFVVHIDNRKCSAEIAPPEIGSTITDDCGFLRYDPAAPGLVHIGWQAWHPAGFGVYRFNIVRGNSGIGSLPLPPIPGNPTPSIPLPLGDEVSSTTHHGDGAGNFFEESPTLRLLAGCTEAAYAIVLHTYAKATNGNGHRISSYDAHALRAFAIAPKK